MSIQLVTYANQTVTPTNDAIIYERAIDQNGIFYGCNVTVSGNEVHITGGYGIICGREFTIQSEAITVTLAPSGTLDGRLYVRLDLADADDPIQLLTATGNTLPPLEQDDDVNYTNGTYEMELATFTVGVSALSDVVETFKTIVGTVQGTETKTLLWTNSDPTASYGTTPISLSLADYDEVEIVYRWATGATTSKSVRGAIGESVRGDGLVVSGVTNLQFASRDFTITSSGVNVAVGNYSYTDYAQWFKYTGGAGNDLIIPYKVYGIMYR